MLVHDCFAHFLSIFILCIYLLQLGHFSFVLLTVFEIRFIILLALGHFF